MDVFTGAIAALLVSQLAARWAPAFDRALTRLGQLRRTHSPLAPCGRGAGGEGD